MSLKISNIRKSFNGKRVLNDISFDINDAEVIGLVGKNGAGKTTLLSIISGLLKSDDGFMNKGNLSIAYLPDVPSFFEYLTAGEYLSLLNNSSKSLKPNSDVLSKLDIVGLKPNLKIGQMSRGMRQRLGIAAVLINDPKIILLDEPTSALDPAGRLELVELIHKLKSNGNSILISTHILDDLEKVCDRVLFIRDGQLVKQTIISESEQINQACWIISFLNKPNLLNAKNYGVTVTQIKELTYKFDFKNQDDLLALLQNASATIISIHNDITSLEDIFKEVCE